MNNNNDIRIEHRHHNANPFKGERKRNDIDKNEQQNTISMYVNNYNQHLVVITIKDKNLSADDIINMLKKYTWTLSNPTSGNCIISGVDKKVLSKELKEFGNKSCSIEVFRNHNRNQAS